MKASSDSRGSMWRRWDPHLHTPGTALNDQYEGDDGWDEFLDRIEASNPSIEALGITDYCGIGNYERVCEYQSQGRITNVKLVFPNVELRYAVGTPRGTPINFHLLVSPDDPEHVIEIQRFLRKLTFKAGDDEYSCSRDELIRLGRAHTGKQLDDDQAFSAGVNQFKISPDQFLSRWSDSYWMRRNALIAISAKSGDGSAGLQHDASLAALRQKLERTAHVIFSSNQRDRAYWLGKGSASLAQIKEKYGGPKPCIHGSDAHSVDRVGAPAHDRFTWIKGDACFESLRQACLEPELRVIVANSPPSGALASRTIDSLAVRNADWLKKEKIELNSGLVGIIGARGSGKTALVEMIAAGANALHPHLSGTSFVKRARRPIDLIGDVSVTLGWRDGSDTTAGMRDLSDHAHSRDVLVQYLSQQFVDQLCSAEGVSDALVREIERVVFEAHRPENRMGAGDFEELLEIKASRSRASRSSSERSLTELRAILATERAKIDAIEAAKKSLRRLTDQIKKDEAERKKLVTKDNQAHAKALEQVSEVANALRTRIQKARRRMEALNKLADEVREFREEFQERSFASLLERHADAGLQNEEWAAFRLDYVGDVDQVIRLAKESTKKQIKGLEGENRKAQRPQEEELESGDTVTSLIPQGSDLRSLPLYVLEGEERRLRKLIGATREKEIAHRKLSARITENTSKIEQQGKIIEVGNEALKNISTLLEKRNGYYEAVFAGIEAEERVLKELYDPISKRLQFAGGALGKLGFSIRRNVDLEDWVAKGEGLLDLRRAGHFRGKGALKKAAMDVLLEAWQAGSANTVAAAMKAFRERYDESLRAGAPVDKADNAAYLSWADQISSWLYSTDHVRVSYGIEHEGVEISTLSPGTRGIVLLLLYLVIDQEDDRPLIIDQPEENLDPQSIYEELVGLFREAKLRRQIIIVTHNANLIVNTDADQVIVATCGQLRPGKLPNLDYVSGSLENASIRAKVCDILEGGEEAFQERAKRLRIDR